MFGKIKRAWGLAFYEFFHLWAFRGNMIILEEDGFYACLRSSASSVSHHLLLSHLWGTQNQFPFSDSAAPVRAKPFTNVFVVFFPETEFSVCFSDLPQAAEHRGEHDDSYGGGPGELRPGRHALHQLQSERASCESLCRLRWGWSGGTGPVLCLLVPRSYIFTFQSLC